MPKGVYDRNATKQLYRCAECGFEGTHAGVSTHIGMTRHKPHILLVKGVVFNGRPKPHKYTVTEVEA